MPVNAPTRHEARMAQAQFAQDADGQVQRNGHDNVSADGHQLTAQKELVMCAALHPESDMMHVEAQ